MADNTDLNAGTGGDTIATDDIGGVKHQRVKIEYGVDGSATDVSDTNPLPIDDAGGTLTVDAPTGTPVNVQIGDGTDQVLVTPAGDLNVAVANGPSVGSFSTFGHIITAGQNNAIEVIFYEDTPQNLTTVTVTNSGTAVSNGGGALFSSSTNTNGTSKSVSLVTAHYHAGSEMYSLFTAAFIAAGVANSYQRIGLYDTNDGFFIGYEGTSFGITTRTGGSDVSVAKASFSEDDLTGGASSLFTRAGVPEAIDLTKLNVFRIRFGWFGSAPTSYEVQAPDGHWVTFHKTLFPNLQTVPSIENADLPITLDIAKTGADATNLQIQTNCWAAGTTHERHSIDDAPTGDSLVELNKSVIAAFNGSVYANVQATAGGNLKISLEEASDGMDIGAGNAGSETLRVSISTDDVNLSKISGAFETTLYKNIDVDETEDAVKASAGQLYWIHAINLSAAVLFLKFYNATVASVVVGTTVPDLTFPIPTPGDTNGAGFTLSIPNGIAFGTAITIAATTGIADNDSGAPGANEVIVNLGFI